MTAPEKEVLFSSRELPSVLEQLETKCLERMRRLTESDLNRADLLDSLKHEFVVNPLQLRRKDLAIEPPQEIMIEAQDASVLCYPGSTVPGNRFIIRVPFTGDDWLFQMQPAERAGFRLVELPLQANVQPKSLRLIYEFVKQNRDDLKGAYERDLTNIEQKLAQQAEDIRRYNEKILPALETAVARRQKECDDLGAFTATLGLPTTENSPSERTVQRMGASKPMKKPIVFICHCKDDANIAEGLYDRLQEIGVDAWLDKKKLILGDEWETEIKSAVDNSDAFVVCLSPEFDNVGFRQKEVRWAFDALNLRPPGKGFLIPYVIKPCSLPEWCKPFHAGSDTSKPTQFDDLSRAIEKHCSWKAPPATPNTGVITDEAGSPKLSPEATEMLEAAVGDDGHILVVRDRGGYRVQAASRNFVTDRAPRTAAPWKAAIEELREHNLIKQVDLDGDVFEVTADGFNFLPPS